MNEEESTIVGENEEGADTNLNRFLQEKGNQYLNGEISATNLLLFLQLAPITEEARKQAYITFDLDVRKMVAEL